MKKHRHSLIAWLALVSATACGNKSFNDYANVTGGAGGQPPSGTGGASGTVGGGGGETPDADSQDAVADVGSDAAPFAFTCNDADLGAEPTIADPCATLTATHTVTAGKPTDETTVDTKTIQDAIGACPAGQSVKLVADGDNVAFLSAPLFMKSGVTLWIDAGVTLFATRNPRDFDAAPGSPLCGKDASNSSCNGLINVQGGANISLVGQGTIDGRGGEPVIDADGGTSTWWQIENALDGNMAGPRIVQVSNSPNFTLYQLTLQNSPKFHIVIDRTNGFKVWGITVNTSPSSPNTDALDPSSSTNGIIAYNKLSTGDDNIAIKGGNGPVDGIIIAHNHFGRGHGMSIGSETNSGVRNITVCDLSLDGAQNGLRIKSDVSRGGIVERIGYSDVCMRGVRNPLVFDPFYTAGATGTLIPFYRDIIVRNTHVLGGGALKMNGHDAMHVLTLTLDNVVFDSAPSFSSSFANLRYGPGPVSIPVPDAGTAVTTQIDPVPADPKDCTNAFVGTD
jgi:hypothetical protein